MVTEKEDDVSVRYRCDLCDYNPYQAWCKGNIARFHAALMRHKQTRRHLEAEAFARGEQPVTIDYSGKVSAEPPTERPPHFYISKLENMIDKLNDRIDALNNLYEGSENDEKNNLKSEGSWVGDFAIYSPAQNREKKGESVNPDIERPHCELSIPPAPAPVLNVADRTFQFKDVERRAMTRFGDGSCITNTNVINAVVRCMNWCEVFMKDKERKARNVAYLKKTEEMIKALSGLVADGWKVDDEDYEAIGERLDLIMEHEFRI